MSGFIDELENWINSLSDEELLRSWRESTTGMRNTSKYEDFFSDRPYAFECPIQDETEKTTYKFEKDNLSNNSLYTPDSIGSFLLYSVWTK